ncbi:MAG TPA: hypothetical protein ENN80_00295 [Candidatus Hydrogenedentes bacterium]|nr:hypothetical protein [Candidatus Hydrogenedentota bacterium]
MRDYTENPMRRSCVQSLEMDLESIEINKPLSPDAFAIKFPEGALVRDRATGKTYRVAKRNILPWTHEGSEPAQPVSVEGYLPDDMHLVRADTRLSRTSDIVLLCAAAFVLLAAPVGALRWRRAHTLRNPTGPGCDQRDDPEGIECE